jgi:hypothetical protein
MIVMVIIDLIIVLLSRRMFLFIVLLCHIIFMAHTVGVLVIGSGLMPDGKDLGGISVGVLDIGSGLTEKQRHGSFHQSYLE